MIGVMIILLVLVCGAVAYIIYKQEAKVKADVEAALKKLETLKL